MHDWRVAAARLRAAANSPDDAPISIEGALPALYPVAIVRLSGLRVAEIKGWLHRHGSVMPAGLVTCTDRRLRGGLVAWRGCGIVFVDGDDPADEQLITIAHEADHFLGDHLYPRMDLLQRLGPSILPVLDGRRPPTRAERVDALLARVPLAHHIHLLGRDEPFLLDIQASEADADSFAREILAPVAAIERQFLQVRTSAAAYDSGDARPHSQPLSASERGVATGLYAAPGAPQPLATCPTPEAVAAYIVSAFGIPACQAQLHARTFVAEHMTPVGLLHRLGLA